MSGRSDQVKARRKFAAAWDDTMIKIWTEQIEALGVVDTGAMQASPVTLKNITNDDVTEIEISLGFLEYGIWVDLGTGRGVDIGNTHRRDMDGWERPRQPRRWYSTKYYSSALRIRDFMAESLGAEFVGMFADLDPDALRKRSDYYRRKGLV